MSQQSRLSGFVPDGVTRVQVLAGVLGLATALVYVVRVQYYGSNTSWVAGATGCLLCAAVLGPLATGTTASERLVGRVARVGDTARTGLVTLYLVASGLSFQAGLVSVGVVLDFAVGLGVGALAYYAAFVTLFAGVSDGSVNRA